MRSVSGQIGLQGHQQLLQAMGAAEARVRHLQADLSGLRLIPSDDDIASLQADGYLAETGYKPVQVGTPAAGS